jgi:hypothetical protein
MRVRGHVPQRIQRDAVLMISSAMPFACSASFVPPGRAHCRGTTFVAEKTRQGFPPGAPDKPRPVPIYNYCGARDLITKISRAALIHSRLLS